MWMECTVPSRLEYCFYNTQNHGTKTDYNHPKLTNQIVIVHKKFLDDNSSKFCVQTIVHLVLP